MYNWSRSSIVAKLGSGFHEYKANGKPAEVVIEEEVRDVSITADRFIDVEGGRTPRGAFYSVGACVGWFSQVVEIYIVVERELAWSVLRSSPSILLHRPRQELLSSFPLLGFHCGGDDDKVSRCNAPATRGVVGEESSRAILAQQLVVVGPDHDGGEAVQCVVTCSAAHFGFTWAESANFFNAFKDFLALSLATLQRRKNHGHFLSALFQKIM